MYQRNSELHLNIPFTCPIFFLSNKIFCYVFLSSSLSQGLQIIYSDKEVCQVYSVKENQDAYINACLLFHYIVFPSLIPEMLRQAFFRELLDFDINIFMTICIVLMRISHFLLSIL